MPFKVKNALATILVTLINIWTTFYSYIWSHWTRSRSCQIFIEFFPDFDFRICKLIDEVLLVTSVWPDWGIYWTLGNFLKPLLTINLPKSATFLGNFVKVSKSLFFLVKSFIGNFYRHLAAFYWSHCWSVNLRRPKLARFESQNLICTEMRQTTHIDIIIICGNIRRYHCTNIFVP